MLAHQPKKAPQPHVSSPDVGSSTEPGDATPPDRSWHRADCTITITSNNNSGAKKDRERNRAANVEGYGSAETTFYR
jgi:hypothetical protein